MIELLNFLDITVERGAKIGMSPEISPPPRVGFLFGWCKTTSKLFVMDDFEVVFLFFYPF